MFFDKRFVADPRVQATYEMRTDRAALQFTTRALRSSRDYDIRACYSRIACPVCLIWGRNDEVSPFDVWKTRVGVDVEANQVVLIPECGHSPMIEKPDLFARHVLKFLEQIGY
jgi:pimeloyl-ACP methyl ester carboxylesterase